MTLLTNIFNSILYQPLLNGLILLYIYLPGSDFGLAIIVLTILIRLVLYPFSLQSIKSQKTLSELQPKIQAIQEKYKNDKEKLARATMELYQKEKFNPFSGCLPLLIQLPILIALYKVFRQGIQPGELSYLYSFVPHPGSINPTFLGLLDLSQANVFLAFLAGVSQFFQTKMVTPKPQKIKAKDSQLSVFSEMMQKQTLYFFPFLTFFLLLNFPSAIGLYWLATNLFLIGQQYFLSLSKKNKPPSKEYA